MGYAYIIFSLLILYPLYSAFKKLLMSDNVYANFSSLLLAMTFICYHLYVFNFDYIPFFGVSTSDDDFVFYSSIVLVIIYNIVYMIAHSRHYRKNKW
ncbi:hypothetical protein C5471_09700 [Photorhabdus tasmaniensis]|uniref:Uncharacterized protein n=1 Tax=Photorhabdus tasmaniensis TaxID=1004159 RepID=A0ABX0GJ96_9GAMM|nr:hypothetical protein [Photorhabdus tasmaniensis]